MKILLLGYGKEGQATEKYFKEHFKDTTFEIWRDFKVEDLEQRDYSSYDIIFRSPSVPPFYLEPASAAYIYKDKFTSVTRYFFDHCPCPIIGVTATKGKGTTCSFIKSILDALGEDAYLVGNIGEPAINALDSLKKGSVVVYEMSSFQLWDLKKSPHIAVIGTIEPDHLNVHKDYNEYKHAKGNICRYQTTDNYLIYYKDNLDSLEIASSTDKPSKIPYPFEIPEDIKSAILLPGAHNVMNAIAAIATVSSFKNISPNEFLREKKSEIIAGLSSFKGLPHRLEFVKELEGVKFYDDNFSTNVASTKVALEAFPGENLVAIIGGRDKTSYKDLPELYKILDKDYIKKIVLIGESGHEFYNRYRTSSLTKKLLLANSLDSAVKDAFNSAKSVGASIILMSPAAASFDMFKDVYDRGDKFKELLKQL